MQFEELNHRQRIARVLSIDQFLEVTFEASLSFLFFIFTHEQLFTGQLGQGLVSLSLKGLLKLEKL